AATSIRVVIDELVDLVLGQKLAARPRVPGLRARLAPPPALRPDFRLRGRPSTPLPPRLPRILRRRLRTVTRTPTRLLLQTPDPLLQPRPQHSQPLNRRRQLQDHLDATLPPRLIDRLRLSPLHTNKFDAPTEDPPSKGQQLNAYRIRIKEPYASWRSSRCWGQHRPGAPSMSRARHCTAAADHRRCLSGGRGVHRRGRSASSSATGCSRCCTRNG